MESVLKVKPEEEDSTLHITSTSSPSPPLSPAFVASSPSPPLSPASAAAPAVIVDTVAAVVPDRVSSTDENAPATVEILEEEFLIIEEEFKRFGLEDNDKDNVDEEDDLKEDIVEVDFLVREAKSRKILYPQTVDATDWSEGDSDEEDDLKEDIVEVDSLVSEAKSRKILYPQRPDATDCSYYLRTGTCRYGTNCRYNHPARKENQARRSASPESAQIGFNFSDKEDLSERMGQQECKYYLRAGGCKFGKACRYNHSREKPMGERECPYYMRTGSCKYGPNCRFHHPDPTAVGGGDVPSGSVSLHPSGALQPASASWSSPPNETVPFLDVGHPYLPMMLPPQGVHSNPESNGYQAPAYTSERSIHPHPALVLNNPTNRTNVSMHNQQHMLDEFPERPGEPECSYFMKTGDCKYRSACKYNHPKNRVPKSSACILSPMGLPLRPVKRTQTWAGDRLDSFQSQICPDRDELAKKKPQELVYMCKIHANRADSKVMHDITIAPAK